MKLKRQTSTTATPTYPATLEYGDLAVANNGVPAFGDKDNLPVPLGTAAEIKQINSSLDANISNTGVAITYLNNAVSSLSANKLSVDPSTLNSIHTIGIDATGLFITIDDGSRKIYIQIK